MINYFKKYTLFQLLFLSLQILVSKLFIHTHVRLVKFPFSIINYQKISFGRNFTAGKNLRIECFESEKDKNLFIGDNVKVNDYVHLACANFMTIGNNVLIGSNVLITDHLHGTYNGENQDSPYTAPDKRKLSLGTVEIEENVWIGDMVSILPDVKIGSGSIIGANSVVTTNIPSNSIAVGIPCRVVKQYNDKTQQWDKI